MHKDGPLPFTRSSTDRELLLSSHMGRAAHSTWNVLEWVETPSCELPARVTRRPAFALRHEC
jgi:hypothetical protein